MRALVVNALRCGFDLEDIEIATPKGREVLIDPQAPWGGFKFSGIGREYGRYGIQAFLETRAILEA